MFSAFTVLSPDGWMVKLRDIRRATGFETRAHRAITQVNLTTQRHRCGQERTLCGHYPRHAVWPCWARLEGPRAREDFPVWRYRVVPAVTQRPVVLGERAVLPGARSIRY